MEPLLTSENISVATGGKILASDPRLPDLIGGVTAAIRRYCGWHVGPVIEETVTLDSAGGSWLKLPSLQVVEVSSVKVNGQEIKDRFRWSRQGLIRLKSGCFPDDYGCVEVTFRHGFEDVSLVRQVAVQVIVNALSSPLGVTREQAGQVSISWSQTAPGVSGGISLLQRDLDILDSYRLESRL